MPCQLLQGLGLRQNAMHGDILFTETSLLDEAEQLAELRVVTEFGVCIQRQMVGKQTDIVLEQMGYPSFLDAGDGGIFTAPEIAVMNEDGVRPPDRSSLKHSLRSSYAGGDTPHVRATLDL